MTTEKQARRKSVEDFFRKTALEENSKQLVNKDFSEFLDKNDLGKRMLYVIPESIGDVYLSTSLFGSLKELYPEYNLYVATKQENFEILEGNPFIYKIIPYIPEMDNIFWMEGIGKHKGFFEISFMPYTATQKVITYTHNSKDKIQFDLI